MVAGLVVTVVLSNFIVIVLLAPKLEPDTVTVVPTAPEVGDIVTVPPTVKVAVAVLVPPVAVTVWLPAAAPEGIVKEALKVPEVLDVTVEGIVVTVAVPNFTVIEVLTGKLEPATITDEPTGPLVGDRVIVGVEEVTVNVASGISLVPKLALILWVPTLASVGMVIDLVNVPVGLAVVLSRKELSKRISTDASAGKPEPVTVTLTPGGPLVGDRVRVATACALLDKPVTTRPNRRIENKAKETYFLFNCHQHPARYNYIDI